GPGTAYAVAGAAVMGQMLEIIGCDESGDWCQLVNGFWIAVAMVDNLPRYLPVLAATMQDGLSDPNNMVLVPEGRFQMGCSPLDPYCPLNYTPLHFVFLEAFYIDK